jgi:hypothetical protein
VTCAVPGASRGRAALALGLALGLAWAVLSGQPARAAGPEASFGRAVRLSAPVNSARSPAAYVFALSCASPSN